jgi:cytochrome c oxidase subunit 2
LVILSTWGIFTVLNNSDLLPIQASTQAIAIDDLFSIHWFLIAFFFSLIIVFMLYSIVVFRRRRNEPADAAGAHFEGNTRLEIIWTVVPLAIVLWLSVIGAESLNTVEARATDAIEVNVIASQWNWRFEYEFEGNPVVSSELVLPAHRQVLLRMHSEDVIHSFWVPEFRVKQDVLPGGEEYIRELRITPNLEGSFKIRCAELCGRLHYDMQANVSVVQGSEFLAWLESQAGECELEAAECGQRWATQFGCVACHSVDGTQIVGPTWLGLAGSTVPLSDGPTVVADTDYLLKSILDPNEQIHEGFQPGIMPLNFEELLTPEQMEQIVAFIESLQ